MEQVLIIGTVWPEPNSSAAGSRMLQIIDFFIKNDKQVTFASTAKKSDFSFPLERLDVSTQEIKLNDSSFDEFVIELNPEIVMFDRFMIEEQFGWRVSEYCPNAIRILYTEDLHSLRKTRESAFRKGDVFTTEMLLNSDIAKREIASV